MDSTKINSYLLDLFDKEPDDIPDFIDTENGLYENRLFDISFQFPESWHIVSNTNFTKCVMEQKMVGEYEHHKEKISEFFELPSFLITKYDIESDKYYGLVSPTLNFNIISKYPDYNGYDLKEYADLIDSQYGFGYHLLKNFKVVNRSDIFKIEGYNAIKYDTEYQFEHTDLEFGINVELSIINVDYGDFFLDFSFTDCKEQNQVERENLKMIIESIKLKS